MDSLNQLVELYLHHEKEDAGTPPEIIFPTDRKEGLQDWALYPLGNIVEHLEFREDETTITEILSDYNIIDKDRVEQDMISSNTSCPYHKVILPKIKNVAFTVVKSCVVVHWRE